MIITINFAELYNIFNILKKEIPDKVHNMTEALQNMQCLGKNGKALCLQDFYKIESETV